MIPSRTAAFARPVLTWSFGFEAILLLCSFDHQE